mmetsp:Transcript_61806/g.137730  ORF Transcript_61806/g.137730 Transcript_61806/m.137730 type:complete len:348 (+) Transcript_61806:1420-2463(+)
MIARPTVLKLVHGVLADALNPNAICAHEVGTGDGRTDLIPVREVIPGVGETCHLALAAAKSVSSIRAHRDRSTFEVVGCGGRGAHPGHSARLQRVDRRDAHALHEVVFRAEDLFARVRVVGGRRLEEAHTPPLEMVLHVPVARKVLAPMDAHRVALELPHIHRASNEMGDLMHILLAWRRQELAIVLRLSNTLSPRRFPALSHRLPRFSLFHLGRLLRPCRHLVLRREWWTQEGSLWWSWARLLLWCHRIRIDRVPSAVQSRFGITCHTGRPSILEPPSLMQCTKALLPKLLEILVKPATICVALCLSLTSLCGKLLRNRHCAHHILPDGRSLDALRRDATRGRRRR